MKHRAQVVGLILGVMAVSGFPRGGWALEDAAGGGGAASDAAYEARVRAMPGVVAYYTFGETTAENPTAETLVGPARPLGHGGPDPLEIVAGRTPDRRAVRLDHSWMEGEPLEVSQGFGLAMWFRKRGQGSQLGNGQTNGMLFAQGDGYWSGLRLTTRYPEQFLMFQVGRPQPQNAVGLDLDEPVPDGVWHHLVATWDGAAMRLYVNGLPAGSVAYDGPYTPTKGKLRIGFAGAGIGSVQLDVDELALFDRAISAEDVLRLAWPEAALPPAAREPFAAAETAVWKRDGAAAEAAFARLSAVETLPAPLGALAQWGRARALGKLNRQRQAVEQYAAMLRDEGLPESLRAVAVRRCLFSEQGVFDALAPRQAYEELLRLDDLSDDDRTAARLALAECLMRDGDGAAARDHYRAVLQGLDPEGLEAWNLRLQIAHSFTASDDHAAARATYHRLAALGGCPAEYRGNALLCVGHSFFLERDYAGAVEAFAAAAADQRLLEHHRAEARERAGEMKRRAAGLSARDPTATRTRIPPLPTPGLVLHVAPGGDDANPGTAEAPLASLRAARDAIRAVKADRGLPPGGATVLVADGDYRVEETFELAAEDSGAAETPIVYRAAPGGSPRFRGGVELGGWQPVADPRVLARLPEDARPHVRQIDLKVQGVTDFGRIEQRGYGLAGYPSRPWVDLYVAGRPMRLARWPNAGFLAVGKVHQGRFGSDEGGKPAVFEFDGDRPGRWARSDDVWMFGYWGHLWAGRGVRVAEIDAAGRRVATVQPSTYGYREGYPYYFFNVLEELDSPGEWYLDRSSGVIYLYPPREAGDAVAEFPMLAAPFVRMENVSHVQFRRLTFELGRAEGLVMRGGQGNLLAGCTFGRLGANAVVVEGGRGHVLLGCDLHTLGAGGVRLSGGDRKSLTPAEHVVENCHVRDFSRVDRTYAPAAHLDGVGIRLAHNLFHDSPHHAIRMEGYEHTVELNEIHSVVYESDDQAGIDIYGNPAYRGIVLRHNFFHHIGSGHDVAGQAGIRLDDYVSSVLMYGNVFYRASGGRFGGIQIHGGKDNVADNNLFIDCKYAVSFSPWGRQRWESGIRSDRIANVMRQGGVDIARPPHSERYPDLARMEENPDRNFIWRSAVVRCGRFSSRPRTANEMMDNVALGEDPGFAHPAARDFRLADDSPLYRRFGFRPIPFDEIGLYEDEHRAAWPVEHEITPHYAAEP